MLRTFVTAAVMGAASLALVGAASAQVVVPKNQEFYATPLQKGAPTDLPGERLVPGASEGAQLINVIVQPTLGPINQLGTGVGTTIAGLPSLFPEPAAAPAPAAEPMVHHRHHHRYAHHSMRAKYKKASRIGGE